MIEDFQKSAVVFTTDLFDLSWPCSNNAPNDSPPWGKDAAAYFCRKLAENSVELLQNEAVAGEGGWHLDVLINNCTYALFLQWAPLGTPPQDFWVMQFNKQIGFLASLFGRHDRRIRRQELSGELMPLIAVLGRIIDAEPRFRNVKWITDEQLSKSY